MAKIYISIMPSARTAKVHSLSFIGKHSNILWLELLGILFISDLLVVVITNLQFPLLYKGWMLEMVRGSTLRAAHGVICNISVSAVLHRYVIHTCIELHLCLTFELFACGTAREKII